VFFSNTVFLLFDNDIFWISIKTTEKQVNHRQIIRSLIYEEITKLFKLKLNGFSLSDYSEINYNKNIIITPLAFFFFYSFIYDTSYVMIIKCLSVSKQLALHKASDFTLPYKTLTCCITCCITIFENTLTLLCVHITPFFLPNWVTTL